MTKETAKWKVQLLSGNTGVVYNKAEGWQRNFIYNARFGDIQFVGGRLIHKVPASVQRMIKQLVKEVM